MCGRYVVSQNADDLAEEFGVDRIDVRERLEPDWNVAPSKQVYAVVTRPDRGAAEEDEPRRRLTTVRWGLVPSWAKDPSIGNRLINARVETAAEKPAFRRAFAARRCLVPAEGFYEWRGEKKGKKQPFFIHPRDGMLAMAGLYEIWRDPTRSDDDPEAFRWTMVILTTDAVDELGEIHDRMPMLVEQERWQAWLDPDNSDSSELMDLLAPAVPGVLDVYPVSTEVNKATNNGPHLLEPVEL
ncbi:SOS response-associated peptidase [Phytoactinopolyspora alkaliphila]|uniref:Abasic site processing protein n=1 Tax=Phytoactinopolyspora alkaliphila TaxID=1783498 RepID=A0A6N9YQE4_9ACTN|nr:SOS response-associated peptidase [Phytoactinopolyspora alkaliphila]NED97233.1 SOS response-associated peptidase [Phytoactinopolyspora alkaliphila]